MLIACPECNGKLSTQAPSCPHCGYQRTVGAGAAPATATTSPPEESTRIDLVPVSIDQLRDASRKRWQQWRFFNSRGFLIGGVTIIVALLVIAAAVHMANRLNGTARWP